MRLFIAIPFQDEMKDALITLQNQLRKQGVRGNYTKPENLHLTLAFIGEYPDPEKIYDIIKEITFRPFTLSFENFGSFGDLWWIGIRENKALNALVKDLRHRLSDQGIPFDKKKFRPHVTLIRRAECPREFVFDDSAFPKTKMVSDEIVLMQSTRGKAGMIYTELAAVIASRDERQQ